MTARHGEESQARQAADQALAQAQSRYDEAIRQGRKLMQVARFDYTVMLVVILAGRFEEAKLAYARALALDPDHLDALLGAAHLYGVSLPSSRDHDELAFVYAERGRQLSRESGDAELAAHFGDGVLRPADVAGGITGAVVQDPVADRAVWREYLETVVRDRDDWSDFYRACRDAAG